MTQIPAGWYPDPAPGQPGTPPTERWWDGTQWTAHVQPAGPQQTQPFQQVQPVQQAPQAPQTQQPPPYAGQYGGAQPGQQGQPGQAGQPGQGQYYSGQYGATYPQQPASAYPGGYGQPGVATTPDGQRLAGWWKRVAATVLDGLVLVSLSVALGWPFVSRLASAYGDFFDEAVRAAENGTAAPDQSALLSSVWGPMLGFLAVSLVVNFVYSVGFLKFVGATPGKLALGLRVRLREQPGPMSWGTVLLRWVSQNVASLVGVVPVLGSIATIYPLLDCLWPLWDSRKQALHDKIAKTNVVVHRR